MVRWGLDELDFMNVRDGVCGCCAAFIDEILTDWFSWQVLPSTRPGQFVLQRRYKDKESGKYMLGTRYLFVYDRQNMIEVCGLACTVIRHNALCLLLMLHIDGCMRAVPGH